MDKKIKNIYTIIFILVFIVVLFVKPKYIYQDSVWNDETVHTWQGYNVFKNPGYLFGEEAASSLSYLPQILMGFLNIFFDVFAAGRVMAFLFSIFGVVMIYFFGKELKNEFVGLVAAMLLGFNHLYWFIGSRALVDAPIAAMMAFFGYCLVRYDKTRSKFWLGMLIASIFLAFITKPPGLIALPITIIYFVVVDFVAPLFDKENHDKKKETKERIFKLLKSPFLYIVIVAIYFILGEYKYTLFDIIIKMITFQGMKLEYFQTLPMIFNWYVLILFMIGVVLTFFYRKKDYFLLTMWFIAVMWSFSVFRLTIPRYLLPLAPAVFVMVGLVLEEISYYVKAFTGFKHMDWVLILFVAFVCFNYYNQGVLMIEDKGYTYTGFQEAGEWISRNVPEDSIIYAGSFKQIRTFSGYEYEIYGGNIRDLYHDTIDEFVESYTEEDFYEEKHRETIGEKQKHFGAPIFLQIDVWEYAGQKAWVFPLDQNKLQAIMDLGFEVKYVVERDYPTSEGLRRIPVVFILENDDYLNDVEEETEVADFVELGEEFISTDESSEV
ncbi:glycosyltransferase family 39 protein [Candidatus Woesearchaeota archaeon]|nr:glycosyltransferase family 39 protein [Candidatus Woesearchaeota archaeon]